MCSLKWREGLLLWQSQISLGDGYRRVSVAYSIPRLVFSSMVIISVTYKIRFNEVPRFSSKGCDHTTTLSIPPSHQLLIVARDTPRHNSTTGGYNTPFRLFSGGFLPNGLEGVVKAGSDIGAAIDQFVFGEARSSSWY